MRESIKKAGLLLLPAAVASLFTNCSVVASDISSEENEAISNHLEHARQAGSEHVEHPRQVSAHTPLPPSDFNVPLHQVELSHFTPSEQKSFEKNQVVLGNYEKNGHRRVRARIKIAAPSHVVWDTVHEERQTDPDIAYSKVLESSGHSSLLEQKFQLIPVVGTSVCVMKNVEVPGERIDYWLTKSDRFKALEGSWVVTPLKEGGTILELSTFIDMGLPVPRNMLDAVTSKKLEKRLQNIRKLAEHNKPNSVAKKPDGGDT